MTALTNRIREGGFIQSEANWARSRDKVTIDGSTGGELGKTLLAGTVLGKITATGKYVISPLTGGDGSQTAAAILIADVTIAGDTVVSVLARDAEVRGEDLTYDVSVVSAPNQATKNAQLATTPTFIFVRTQGGVQTTS
jgi:hypothetical protein